MKLYCASIGVYAFVLEFTKKKSSVTYKIKQQSALAIFINYKKNIMSNLTNAFFVNNIFVQENCTAKMFYKIISFSQNNVIAAMTSASCDNIYQELLVVIWDSVD